MGVILETPLKPGDIHKFHLTLDAILYKQSIDYVFNGNIFIHIKARQENNHLVVNDFVDGAWRQEQHIPVPELAKRSSLDVVLEFFPTQVRISVPGQEAILFDRKTSVLDVSMIDFPATIAFERDQVREPQRPQPGPSAPAAPPAKAKAKAAPAPGVQPAAAPELEVTLMLADVMHVAGQISGRKLPKGATLVALVDERPGGRLSLSPETLTKDGDRWRFSLPWDDLAIVADGMTASVALDLGGELKTLATMKVASQFVGGLDRCSESLVRGWAANPYLPTRPVLVDIYLNDSFQGNARCDLPRDDLRQMDAGFAASGFLYKFPNAIFLPESSDTAVRVKIHNTEVELLHSPWWICRAIRLPGQNLTAAPSATEGAGAAGTHAAGQPSGQDKPLASRVWSRVARAGKSLT